MIVLMKKKIILALSRSCTVVSSRNTESLGLHGIETQYCEA